MHKFLKALLVFLISVLEFLDTEEIFAANKIIKVKNDIYSEVSIYTGDFVTFLPKGNKKKKYTFFSEENGKILFQFGNGKFWASDIGSATVVISALDRSGNINFLSTYKVNVSAKPAENKVTANKIVGTEASVQNNDSSQNGNSVSTGSCTVPGGTSSANTGHSSNINSVASQNNNLQASVVIIAGEEKELNIATGTAIWTSSNPDVAEVTDKGVVKGKTKGNTLITAKVNDRTYGCVVSVTSELRKNAAAFTHEYSSKSKYSQGKRMQEGFYDCSSLVWRAYNKYGFNILNAVYAPTAALMGQYYYETGKIVEGGITAENISNMVFEPGDLFFLEGNDNGRFRGIYHVEMISGYKFKGFDPQGKPIIALEFANRNQVNFKGFVGRP